MRKRADASEKAEGGEEAGAAAPVDARRQHFPSAGEDLNAGVVHEEAQVALVCADSQLGGAAHASHCLVVLPQLRAQRQVRAAVLCVSEN